MSDAEHRLTRAKHDFIPTLQFLRQIDRGAMIFAFLFFCGLVWYAWRKRAADADDKPKTDKPKPATKEPKR